MEQLGIYAIFDKKHERYDTPFFAVSDIFAERRFNMMINEQGTFMSIYKDEFVLEKVGTFNVISCEVESENKVIIEGKQINLIKEGEK